MLGILISRIKDPSVKHLGKLKKCYEKFIIMTKNPDRATQTPLASRLEKAKAAEVLGQYNKILYPYRKKYLNILGKYIYDIACPNLVCFCVLMPIVIDFNSLIFGKKTQGIEIFGSMIWNILLGMQISKIIVWIESNLDNWSTIVFVRKRTVLLLTKALYLQKLVHIILLIIDTSQAVNKDTLIITFSVAAIVTYGINVVNRLNIFHVLRRVVFMYYKSSRMQKYS